MLIHVCFVGDSSLVICDSKLHAVVTLFRGFLYV